MCLWGGVNNDTNVDDGGDVMMMMIVMMLMLRGFESGTGYLVSRRTL